MRAIRKLVASLAFIVIAAVVVMFALANRGDVTVNLWPLPFSGILPLSVAMLGALAVGILLGGVISWTSGAGRRLRHRSQRAAPTTSQIAAARDRPAENLPPAEQSRQLPAVAE